MSAPSLGDSQHPSKPIAPRGDRPTSQSAATGASSDFLLHTLGWREFQDLCASVLSEILGQQFQVFAPGPDGGRDGAFRGQWSTGTGEPLGGTFTAQCKHTSDPTALIRVSDLEEDFAKAERLADVELADIYILMTNAKLTAEAEAAISARLLSCGVKRPLVFGREWFSLKISESPRLRALVPRVYGLGDLSEILDERAYSQAAMLLESLGPNLRTFVPTGAYRRALEALSNSRFVLLLGEPAAGKTTIASTLCLHAADVWQARTIRVANPTDFQSHWNPNEPRQLFWVDDAFGAMQYQADRVRDWNQLLPSIHAAMQKGTRFILTSRDYIWQRARDELKIAALPSLTEAQVVIRVSELTETERERILYNHIRLGDQPREFRTAIKRFLGEVARHPGFLPETARRLGHRFFTRGLRSERRSVLEFVAAPEAFLKETIAGLGQDDVAALAVVFAYGARLDSPVASSAVLERICAELGSSLHGIKVALESLNGCLVRLERGDEGTHWRFQHPTVGDVVGSYLAQRLELVGIYVQFAPLVDLLRDVTAGDVGLQGAKVVASETLYPVLLRRLKAALASADHRSLALWFMAYRASAPFLACAVTDMPTLSASLVPVSGYLETQGSVDLLARLRVCGLLDEDIRSAFVRVVRELSTELPDAGFLTDASVRSLVDAEERDEIMESVSTLLDTDQLIGDFRSNYTGSEGTAEEHFSPLKEAFNAYRRYFKEKGNVRSAETFRRAMFKIDRTVLDIEEYEPDEGDWDTDTDRDFKAIPQSDRPSDRDPFDDVDA